MVQVIKTDSLPQWLRDYVEDETDRRERQEYRPLERIVAQAMAETERRKERG